MHFYLKCPIFKLEIFEIPHFPNIPSHAFRGISFQPVYLIRRMGHERTVDFGRKCG